MRLFSPAAFGAVICFVLYLQVPANAETIDFVSRIEASPEAARTIGLHKLTAEEKEQLNLLFNAAYEVGYQAAEASDGVPSSSEERGARKATPAPAPVPRSSYVAYRTKIESDDGDILRLENGAMVEVVGGYLGYLGYRKEAILLDASGACKIWIEGKRLYRCELLRSPRSVSATPVEALMVSEVKGGGEILVALDGRVFEVDPIYTIFTSLWLAPFDALVLNELEMLNLDSGDEPVQVRRLK